jgi:hypothetical protein
VRANCFSRETPVGVEGFANIMERLDHQVIEIEKIDSLAFFAHFRVAKLIEFASSRAPDIFRRINMSQTWKKCSACKKEVLLGSKYFICSVSTCQGLRTGYAFCSVACFETHLPGARHRDAGAVEQVAPTTLDTIEPHSSQRIVIRSSPTSSSTTTQTKSPPQEVLVVASRFKEFIAAHSEMNTSASVMDVVSDHLRALAVKAIENARKDGRKTVMDRDFEFLLSLLAPLD